MHDAQSLIHPDFWKGKRVFITGHTGFKGGWLAFWLSRMGARVTGYALDPDTDPSLFHELHLDKHIVSIKGDIIRKDDLHQAMIEARPEIVFHLAAQAIVKTGYDDPSWTWQTNVMGTLNVLEGLRQCPDVRAAVMITTDKCYENREWHWPYRETDTLGGHDPYSSSKAAAEILVASMRRSFFQDSNCAIATVRAGNVIGGGDWAAFRLVPDSIRAFIKGESVVLRQPNAIRPWQHVLEPLSGYLILAQKLIHEGDAFAEAWNFGPRDIDTRTVKWVVHTLAGLWGGKAKYHIEGSPPAFHEAGILKLDWAKARARLGWSPRWTLEQTLHHIVTYSRAGLEGQDLETITAAQIDDFLAQMPEGYSHDL